MFVFLIPISGIGSILLALLLVFGGGSVKDYDKGFVKRDCIEIIE